MASFGDTRCSIDGPARRLPLHHARATLTLRTPSARLIPADAQHPRTRHLRLTDAWTAACSGLEECEQGAGLGSVVNGWSNSFACCRLHAGLLGAGNPDGIGARTPPPETVRRGQTQMSGTASITKAVTPGATRSAQRPVARCKAMGSAPGAGTRFKNPELSACWSTPRCPGVGEGDREVLNRC